MPHGRRPGERPGGGTIQSLERGLRILEFVGRRGPGVSMAEIARDAGLHTSTAFHLLRTLVLLGYVIQDDVTRQYRLGPRLLQVAAAAWGEAQLGEAAAPFLAEMARETGESSHLAVFDRGEAVMLQKVDGDAPVRLAERVGYPRPAYCTAIGKVLLAWLDEHERAAYLAQTRLEPRTPKTITAAGALEAELARVREQGDAFDDEEYTQGIRCIAAPVRNFTGRIVAAVGLSGPVWRISLDRVGALTEVVRATAARLSAHLGQVEGDGRGAATATAGRRA